MKLLLALGIISMMLAWSPAALSKAPLTMAKNGQLEDLKLWISLKGENAGAKERLWVSFATKAAEHGQLSTLKYIHELGVRLDQFDSFHHSPLHSAATDGKIDVVRWLLDLGIDPNLQETVNHPTALHQAARYGRTEAVRILLQAGADPLINSLSGTPFELADDFTVLYMLMNHWAENGDGMPPPAISPAAWWSFTGHPDQVPERLLRQDMQKPDCNALHWTAVSGHIPTLEYLLKMSPRAALSSKCMGNWTPFKLAIRFNQPEVVSLLLNHWQQVTAGDVRLAVQYGSASLARTLFDSLEKPNESLEFYPRKGDAVFTNYNAEDLKYLINKRVLDPRWVLYQIAKRDSQMIDMAPLIVEQGIPVTRVMAEGLRANNRRLVDWAIAQNPPLAQPNEVTASPFIVAAKAGNTQLAKRFWQEDAVFGDDNYYERLGYFAAAGWTEKVLSYTRRRPDLLAYALREAAYGPNIDTIVDLIKAGAKATSRYCRTVFVRAAYLEEPLPIITLFADIHSGDDECLTAALVDAVREGRTEWLAPLLRNGANPNGVGNSYHNTVVIAASDEKLVILKALLKAGADPSVVKKDKYALLALAQLSSEDPNGPQGETMPSEAELPPLIKAIKEGDTDTLSTLIAAGADLNETNDKGETPAHIAIRSGQLEAASLLLNYDVLLTKDKRGRTPFHLIGAYGSPELAARAIELSNGVYMDDDARRYPLDYASRMNEQVAIELAKASARHKDSLPAIAAHYGHIELLDYLNKTAKQDTINEYADKPEAGYFAAAVAQNDSRQYRSLLAGALAPNDNFLGESLLSRAARYGDMDAFELLVNKGAKLAEGFFLLDRGNSYKCALLSDKPQLAEILINTLEPGKREEFLVAVLTPLAESMTEDALVSWLESDGKEALNQDLAAKLNGLISTGDQLNLLNALIRAGADLEAEDDLDRSPVDMATKYLQKDINWGHRIALIHLLLKNEEDDNFAWLSQLFKSNEELATPIWAYLKGDSDSLPEAGTKELNAADPISSLTFLDAAVLMGEAEAIDVLLQRGAEITPQTLHIAAQSGHVEAIEALSPLIYDLNARDSHGNTPLMTAVAANQTELVATLLSMGARPNVYNNDYKFPLKLAVLNMSKPVVEMLLAHGAHPDGYSEHMSTNALRAAVVMGDLSIVKTLVEAGASEDPLLGPPPYSVLPAAYKFAGEDVIAYLERTFPRTEQQQQYDLDMAWEHGSEWSVQHLTTHGISF